MKALTTMANGIGEGRWEAGRGGFLDPARHRGHALEIGPDRSDGSQCGCISISTRMGRRVGKFHALCSHAASSRGRAADQKDGIGREMVR